VHDDGQDDLSEGLAERGVASQMGSGRAQKDADQPDQNRRAPPSQTLVASAARSSRRATVEVTE
jgi:hypothetical protein